MRHFGRVRCNRYFIVPIVHIVYLDNVIPTLLLLIKIVIPVFTIAYNGTPLSFSSSYHLGNTKEGQRYTPKLWWTYQ